MIARQRVNLQRTFAQSERSSLDPQTVRRLAKAEQELADLTAEFLEGWGQRFGPIPCLHEAHQAMKSGTAALEQKQVSPAAGFEETALAGLIKARQNVRQMLSQQSKSASECRKFDAQQKQKLRLPPKKDDKERFAKVQEEVEKLAKEEKQLSEQLCPSSSSSPASASESSSGNSSSKGSPKERQQKAKEKADELKVLIRSDEALTDLARERMDRAAEAVEASAKSLQEKQDQKAGQQASQAADHLQRLARQIAALKTPDLTARLGQAQNLAGKLAKQEQALNGELQDENGQQQGNRQGQAQKQRKLAEDTRTLGDLLSRLEDDAAGSAPQLGRELRQANETFPTKTIEEQMRRAADALEKGKLAQAGPDVDESSRMLSGLAQQLEAAHRGLVQPQLDRLLAAEEQAAETQKALQSVNDDQQKAEAEKRVSDLRDTMDSFKAAQGKMAQATSELQEALRQGGVWRMSGERHDPLQGRYLPPVSYEHGVRDAVGALQAKIQEIILQDALLERDEGVPPQYKAWVEEYYRILSEDTR